MTIADLLKENERLKNQLAEQDEELQRLKEDNENYRKVIYGKRSEKRSFDSAAHGYSNLFDEAEETLEEESRAPRLIKDEDRDRNRQKRGGRNPLPEDLERDIHRLNPSPEEMLCEHCNSELQQMGEKVTEKIEVIPEKVYVKRIVRPQFVCKSCNEISSKIAVKPLPKMLLPKASAGAGFMAHAIHRKFGDRIPFYHYAKSLGHAGIDISRQDLSRWTIDVFENHLQNQMDELRKALFQTDYIQGDETPLQVLTHKKKNYIWAFHGLIENIKIAYFHHTTGRSAEFLKDWLKDFSGVYQTDGYESYDTHLGALPDVIHGGCNTHARRKFTECKAGEEAEFVLNEYAKIYKIEADLVKANAPPELILATRKEKSLPVLQGLRDRMNDWALKFRPTGNFGKAVKYFLNEYEKLIVFIYHPEVRPDTNLVENDIRPFAVGRKNWLFAGSERGAKASAAFYTLIQIANLNGWDPYSFLHRLFLTIESTDGEIDLVSFILGYSPADA